MDYQVMAQKDQLPVNPTIIKVIGAGGCGLNAVDRMMECNVQFVDFIVANTDMQVLNLSKAPSKLAIGAKLTGGLGAGGDPNIGEQAAIEDTEIIANMLRGAHMVFITAGMGGGTGTGSAPVIAKIARDLGALTVAIVTKPFHYEGRRQMQIAEAGIEKLRKVVDTLVIIPNERILKLVPPDMVLSDAYKVGDDVLRQAVQGISDIITRSGLVNIDFADVRATMANQGDALMGVGVGTGDNRAVDAATNAISNPLLEDCRIEGATKILVNIYSSAMITAIEVRDIMEIVTVNAHPDVKIIHGITLDPAMEDKISVTVIATGFNDNPSIPFTPEHTQTQEAATAAAPVRHDTGNASTDLTAGEFISVSDWGKLRKPVQPHLPGLGPRNAPPDSIPDTGISAVPDIPVSAPECPPLQSSRTRYSVHVQLPVSGDDLDIPTVFRNKR